MSTNLNIDLGNDVSLITTEFVKTLEDITFAPQGIDRKSFNNLKLLKNLNEGFNKCNDLSILQFIKENNEFIQNSKLASLFVLGCEFSSLFDEGKHYMTNLQQIFKYDQEGIAKFSYYFPKETCETLAMIPSVYQSNINTGIQAMKVLLSEQTEVVFESIPSFYEPHMVSVGQAIEILEHSKNVIPGVPQSDVDTIIKSMKIFLDPLSLYEESHLMISALSE